MRRPAWLVRMIEKLIGDGFRTFVEIGPGSVLRDSILSTARMLEIPVTVVVPLQEDRPETIALDEALSALSRR